MLPLESNFHPERGRETKFVRTFAILASLVATVMACGPAPQSSQQQTEQQTDLLSLKACGNGVCSGNETCSTCVADCGACPPTASCGDGTCNGNETCSTCAADCGACSSTGKKIAFVSSRDGNWEIYSANADGTGITRLTNDPAKDDEPTWSPDGRYIAFTSDRNGSREIFVMNADGSNVVQRTFSASYSQLVGELYPAWSPDGSKIAYSTLSDGSANIWVVSPTSGSPTLLLAKPGWDAQPAWSPDGARLAVVSDWFAYDIVYDIYLTSADGSGFTALTGNIFDHYDYFRPSWSPSGTKIAVAITQTVGVDQYVTNLGVMNDDGSALTPLISAATWARSSWSPDGQTIAFTSGAPGALNVSWVKADGSSSGVIVSNGWNPDWQR
jgi:Tol biopolymer transport system component